MSDQISVLESKTDTSINDSECKTDSVSTSEGSNNLKDTLNRWNLNDIHSTLTACDVTHDRIKHLNQNEIKEILPEEKNIGMCCDLLGKTSILMPKDTSKTVTTMAKNTPVTSWLAKQEYSNLEDTHLMQNILNSSPAGQSIIKFFETNKILNKKFRDELVKCLIEYYFDYDKNCYVTPEQNEMKRLRNGIVNVFPTEDPDTYYIPRKDGITASGKLYNRFKNIKKKISSTSVDCSNAKKRKISTKSQEYHNQESSKAKMKEMSNTDVCAIELWNETFLLRQSFIANESNSLKDISDNWNFYMQPGGEKFIDIDFYLKYPHKKLSLFDKWEAFENKIKQVYITKLEDNSHYKILLNRILTEKINKDSPNCLLVMMMNHILYPEVQNENEKSAIHDGANSLIQHKFTLVDLFYIKENKLKSRATQKSPSYVIVIGSDLMEINEFYVCLDNTLLKCSSFLSSLDICLKTFHVFNLPFPKESALVWECLQKYFYDFDETEGTNSSALAELL